MKKLLTSVKFIVVASFSFGSLVSPVFAAPGQSKLSDQFTWKWEFEGASGTASTAIDVYNNSTAAAGTDNAADWAFTTTNSATGKTAVLDGNGNLRLTSSATTNNNGSAYIDNLIWDVSGITQGSGYTFEIRVKVVNDHNTLGFGLQGNPNDASQENAVSYVNDSVIKWGPSTDIGTGYVNNDNFHVYRVAAEYVSNQVVYTVWRDEQLVADNLSSASAGDLDRLIFGDFNSAAACILDIDYIRFESGAYSPAELKGTVIEFGSFGNIFILALLSFILAARLVKKP